MDPTKYNLRIGPRQKWLGLYELWQKEGSRFVNVQNITAADTERALQILTEYLAAGSLVTVTNERNEPLSKVYYGEQNQMYVLAGEDIDGIRNILHHGWVGETRDTGLLHFRTESTAKNMPVQNGALVLIAADSPEKGWHEPQLLFIYYGYKKGQWDKGVWERIA